MIQSELKATLKLALPVVISQVGMMTLGLVDTLVIGQVSAKDLAGVAAGSNLFWPVAVVGIGAQMGLDTLISQNFGAGNVSTCRKLLFQGLHQAFLLTLALAFILAAVIFLYPFSGAVPEVIEVAMPYVKVIAWTLPGVLFFGALQRAWQAMNVALPFTLILVVGNIGNYLLAVGLSHGKWGLPAMGAVGIAWATFINRYLMLVLAILFTHWALKKIPLEKNDWRWNSDLQKKLITIGLPAAGHFSLEVGVFALVSVLAATLGTLSLAAHQIALSVASFTFMIPLGLSTSAAVRVGTLLGAGDVEGAKRAGWINIALGVAFMGFTALCFLIFPKTIFGWFTQDPAVSSIGLQILVWVAIFQIADGIQVTTAGALRGTGDTKSALIANAIGHYPIGLALGVGLCFGLGRGISGLWFGLMTGLISVAFMLLFRWKKKSRLLSVNPLQASS